jgi:pentatricopeptide repeat domain-containing protein 3
MLVYELLQKSNAEISPELKQSFFELICFYNCEEPLDEDLIEERWFAQTEKGKERYRKSWKDGGLAETVFDSFEVKDSKAYSTIIRGMCKFYQVERAWALLNDALAKNIPVDVECYNSILNVSNFLKESTELRWEFVQEILKLMKDQNIQPNLGTLNGALNAVRLMGGKQIREYCLAVLAEFKPLNIEPSLASWAFVLQTFCRERGPVSHILIDILNEIEGKEFHIQDPRDTNFFSIAMDIARNHLNDVTLCRRVNDLLHFGDNYNLIGDSYKESVYYRNFFFAILTNEPLESFMETYYRFVPNIYVPEPAVMEEILKAVDVTGSIEHIPLLWSNMVQFDHIGRESCLNAITKVMVENPPNPQIKIHEGLTEKFATAAYDMWTKIEERNENRTKAIIWTGKMLSDILLLICNSGDIVKATEVFENIVKNQDKIMGEPTVTSLEKFTKLCIENKKPDLAISCLQLSNDIGFNETKQLAKDIVIGFTLDGHMTKKVMSIVGLELVEEAEAEKQKIRELKIEELQKQKENETK